jgi:hypothetical protein
MPADTTAPAAEPPHPLPCKRTLAPCDRDSIYGSKDRWGIILQRLGPMSIQYLLIVTRSIRRDQFVTCSIPKDANGV